MRGVSICCQRRPEFAVPLASADQTTNELSRSDLPSPHYSEALEREATLLLANVHERVGDLLQFNNHHEAMLEEYRRALELRLGAKHEEQLSHSYFMVGLAYELCMKKRGVESPE